MLAGTGILASAVSVTVARTSPDIDADEQICGDILVEALIPAIAAVCAVRNAAVGANIDGSPRRRLAGRGRPMRAGAENHRMMVPMHLIIRAGQWDPGGAAVRIVSNQSRVTKGVTTIGRAPELLKAEIDSLRVLRIEAERQIIICLPGAVLIRARLALRLQMPGEARISRFEQTDINRLLVISPK